MARVEAVQYASTGHHEILASLLERHRLALVRRFRSNHTLCGLATTSADEKVFIKVKGYRRAGGNEAKFRRAVAANRMARKIEGDVMPRLLEFSAFERDDCYWLTTVSAYCGEPVSRGMFFSGDGAAVGGDVLKRLADAIGAAQRAPSASFFYAPSQVAAWIGKAFGPGAPCWAAEWTSAHCDFHWGNILEGGRHIVDWDMFSLAPKGFDAASIVLYSASDPSLFRRVHNEFSDVLNADPARVALLFAAARILTMMTTAAYAQMRVHEPSVREAVRLVLGRDDFRSAG